LKTLAGCVSEIISGLIDHPTGKQVATLETFEGKFPPARSVFVWQRHQP
jgi:hypothetical protein